MANPVTLLDKLDAPFGTAGNPIVTSGAAGSTDATAANQVLQIAQETAINTALGTVTASPTANTVLDRLKALLTGIVLAAGSAIIGKVGIDQTTNGTTNAVALTGYSNNNITTATTTTVKSGAGTLHGINVNSLGTVASSAVVYDNTAGSGTKIATLDTLTLKGWNQFDVNFATGLTIVTTGTVAPDISVSYR